MQQTRLCCLPVSSLALPFGSFLPCFSYHHTLPETVLQSFPSWNKSCQKAQVASLTFLHPQLIEDKYFMKNGDILLGLYDCEPQNQLLPGQHS
jgi:hypothetical protein